MVAWVAVQGRYDDKHDDKDDDSSGDGMRVRNTDAGNNGDGNKCGDGRGGGRMYRHTRYYAGGEPTPGAEEAADGAVAGLRRLLPSINRCK
jgi:hypothetical protein